MKIVISGATGFVGRHLCEALAGAGHEVAALSRNADAARRSVPSLANAYAWNPASQPAPAEALHGADAVIHLAGESVVGRWTAAKRQAIRDSRVLSTENLVRGLANLDVKPKALISASAIGYYGDRGEEELTEDSPPASDFLGNTSVEWEEAARGAEALGVRTVRTRIGIILGEGGGALGAMLTPFKLGVGGPLGSGRQWWSWIALQDLLRLFAFLLESDFQGVVNATAPHPERQKDFASVLGRVINRPAFLPAPAFVLKLMLGGFEVEILGSKRVSCARLEALGFRFAHPELEGALRSELDR